MISQRTLLLLAVTLLACQRAQPESDHDSTTTTTGADSTFGATVTSPGPPPPRPLGDIGDGGHCFLCTDEGLSIECDSWEQDCPDGEKCMPWANDGGNSWNATKCVPLDPAPVDVGEPCTVEGSGVSGIDNCGLGVMCWDVDPETLEGECVPFCNGAAAAPFCDDPERICPITSDGVLILCHLTCDPLASACNERSVCAHVQNDFICVFQSSSGQYGDPCEFINVCADGLFCAAAAAVPGCSGSQGCCSHFCDVGLPAAQQCAGFPEQQCVPWYEDGTAPPELDNLGACAVPQ